MNPKTTGQAWSISTRDGMIFQAEKKIRTRGRRRYVGIFLCHSVECNGLDHTVSSRR